MYVGLFFPKGLTFSLVLIPFKLVFILFSCIIVCHFISPVWQDRV